jgi:hypothetical protein
MKTWRSLAATVGIAVLAVVVDPGVPRASSPQYAVTNNNNNGANNATVFQHTGPLLQLVATPATGGSGNGDGFGSQPQQVIVKSGSAICIYHLLAARCSLLCREARNWAGKRFPIKV